MGNSSNEHLSENEIKKCIEDYNEATDRLTKLVRTVVSKLERRLAEEGILAKVSGRVKSTASFTKKLEKWSTDSDKAKQVKSAKRGVFDIVGDLAAVRVMTYVEKDRDRVVKLISDERLFCSRESKKNFESERKEDDERIKNDPSNFYRATHLQICLVEEDLKSPINSNLRRDHCELQITSMLAHVWNEVEHDIGYKQSEGKLSEGEKTSLESLGMLTKAGDNIIANLIEENEQRKRSYHNQKTKIRNAEQLGKFLCDYYGKFKVGKNSIDFERNSLATFNALEHIDHLFPYQIKDIISPKRLQDAYLKCRDLAGYMERRDVMKNRVDPLSCDVVLITLLVTYSEELTERDKHGGHREIAIGKHFLEWQNSKRKSP